MCCSGSISGVNLRPVSPVPTLRDVITLFPACTVSLPAVKTSRGADWRVEPCPVDLPSAAAAAVSLCASELSPSLNVLYGLLSPASSCSRTTSSSERLRPLIRSPILHPPPSDYSHPNQQPASSAPKLSDISPELLFPSQQRRERLMCLRGSGNRRDSCRPPPDLLGESCGGVQG